MSDAAFLDTKMDPDRLASTVEFEFRIGKHFHRATVQLMKVETPDNTTCAKCGEIVRSNKPEADIWSCSTITELLLLKVEDTSRMLEVELESPVARRIISHLKEKLLGKSFCSCYKDCIRELEELV